MAAAARQGDSIKGTFAGEHNGHNKHPHSPGPISGNISGGCSNNVFINGKPAAIVGSTTTEHDECCGTNSGKVAEGSSKVFINGKPAARKGDALAPHSGSGNVSSGSDNVFIGG